jgi:hypothetical protein
MTSGGPGIIGLVGTQYRNSASHYATVLCYLGHRESGVVLGLPKTLLDPPLATTTLSLDE